MQDKDMVNDILAGTKASITCYTRAITECSNQQLRSTFQTLRNEAEQYQYQLYQMAEQKGYYVPASQASSKEVSEVKTALTSSTSNVGTTMK